MNQERSAGRKPALDNASHCATQTLANRPNPSGKIHHFRSVARFWQRLAGRNLLARHDRSLRELNDHTLSDIGLRRDDLPWKLDEFLLRREW